MVYKEKLLLKIIFFLLSNKFVSGNFLWCHQGGIKDYTPVQCSPSTHECFKFECEGIDSTFVARGCGVDGKTKSVGLKNESCFQAQSVCQHLGGISHCHICNDKYMCNSDNYKIHISYFSIALILSLGYIVFANF
uniref:UPAR/Ly6 domain-containing protein n=1 Tax=Parastrongyloides trichosuri TaxID=131310 RepID=A0A0N5A4A0_PARTI